MGRSSLPGWSYRLGGLIRISPEKRWGFDFAANIWGREGLCHPLLHLRRWTSSSRTDTQRSTSQAVDRVDDYRHPNLHLVDLRIDKELRSSATLSVTIGIECFNALNESTVLRRNR